MKMTYILVIEAEMSSRQQICSKREVKSRWPCLEIQGTLQKVAENRVLAVC